MLFDPKWDEVKVDAVGECLLRAADVIERDGWCHSGRAIDAQGRKCAIGAITVASDCFGDNNYMQAFDRLCAYLGRYDIPCWSDSRKSGDEVAMALRGAAYSTGGPNAPRPYMDRTQSRRRWRGPA